MNKLSFANARTMGKHDRCCVGPCDNDKRYPEDVIKRNNVRGKLKWHKFPALSNPTIRKEWETMIQKGRKGFSSGNWTYVCSNHFIDGAPTRENPRPSLFLTR